MLKLATLLVILGQYGSGGVVNEKFPPGFLFGAGSSAVQDEGAWNEDGKTESGWNFGELNIPNIVIDNSTSAVACDSYHRYKEDIPFLNMAGMNTYHFSMSWPRILPTGYTDYINPKGVEFYNNLINDVLSHNITPIVTMNHFDIPVGIAGLGGWTNSSIVDVFGDYAEVLLRTFGDRVKHWVTIHEPNWDCILSYRFGLIAPLLNASDDGAYTCTHGKILAHAEAYRRFKTMPSSIQDGAVMGWSVLDPTYYPWGTLNKLDYAANEIAFEFYYGWVINPFFGTGGYPPLMRAMVDKKSLQEGRMTSKLPRFTPEQLASVKGSADFLSFNQFTALFTSFVDLCPDYYLRQVFSDSGVFNCQKSAFNKTQRNYQEIVPGSLRDALTNIRVRYNNPPVLIAENGYADGVDENLTYNPARERFFQGTISEVMQSIADGSNLLGYVVWSLLDNFDWNNGYTFKYGMVHVDYKNNLTRSAKPILSFFRNVAKYGINMTDT